VGNSREGSEGIDSQLPQQDEREMEEREEVESQAVKKTAGLITWQV
jgi:hypothetical protein